MPKTTDAYDRCLFHWAWEKTRGLRITRLVALGHAATMRIARDLIDRRLAAIERATPPDVREPAGKEPSSHD